MNRNRLFARVVAYTLPVVLVLGVVPVAGASSPSATISPENHVFPSAVVGYGEQAAQVFTITNTGDVDLRSIPGDTGWSASIAGGFDGDLLDGDWNHIKPGQSLTFYLRPGTNLPVGTHTGEFIGRFLPALDRNELDRIQEEHKRRYFAYIAIYLGITTETLDNWSEAEWESFWSGRSGGFYNSPTGRQWDETQRAYWLSVGRIELRAPFSFTVTADPNFNPHTGR